MIAYLDAMDFADSTNWRALNSTLRYASWVLQHLKYSKVPKKNIIQPSRLFFGSPEAANANGICRFRMGHQETWCFFFWVLYAVQLHFYDNENIYYAGAYALDRLRCLGVDCKQTWAPQPIAYLCNYMKNSVTPQSYHIRYIYAYIIIYYIYISLHTLLIFTALHCLSFKMPYIN